MSSLIFIWKQKTRFRRFQCVLPRWKHTFYFHHQKVAIPGNAVAPSMSSFFSCSSLIFEISFHLACLVPCCSYCKVYSLFSFYLCSFTIAIRSLQPSVECLHFQGRMQYCLSGLCYRRFFTGLYNTGVGACSFPFLGRFLVFKFLGSC